MKKTNVRLREEDQVKGRGHKRRKSIETTRQGLTDCSFRPSTCTW